MSASFKSGLDAIELLARIECATFPLEQLALQLDALEAMDDALKPELDAVRDQIRESLSVLRRAGQFVHARYDVGNEAA